ncbi:MAG: nuclear transport factor 2 family protein [Pyrinomonadaceae bacterium]
MSDENIAAVEKYLEALRTKDLSLAPFADGLRFSDSIAGEGVGAEKLRAFLSGFLPGITSVRVLKHVSQGEYVATHWEVDGVFGIISILELFRVNDGMITESIANYDPGAVLGT